MFNRATESAFIEISTVTDIYLLKKDKLIEFCEQNKLKTSGKVSDLRTRVGRFFRGKLRRTDTDERLDQREIDEVLEQSISNRIDLDKLEIELGIKDSDSNSDESSIGTIGSSVLDNTKQEVELVNNKLISVQEKVDLCLDISNNFLSNKNNFDETGASSNHVIDKIKISPDKGLVQYLKNNILNNSHMLTKNTKMTIDENKKNLHSVVRVCFRENFTKILTSFSKNLIGLRQLIIGQNLKKLHIYQCTWRVQL